MLLADATSKEEVARALADGDEELLDDIEEKLDESRRWWDHNVGHFAENRWDFAEYIQGSTFLKDVIDESPSEFSLSTIPESYVQEALNSLSRTAAGASSNSTRARKASYVLGPFTTDDHRHRYIGERVTFSAATDDDYYFPGEHLPENAGFIPAGMAEKFWESTGYVDWQETSFLDEEEGNTGTAEGDRVTIYAAKDEFAEWCRDIIATYVSAIVAEDPVSAVETFFRGLRAEDPKLADKLAAARLPDDDLLGFATSWFYSESGHDEVLTAIVDYFSAIEGGAELDREVVAEWSRQDIIDMGIRKGTLFEEAPWKLLKLHPSDLRLESVLMSHCVGEKGMGYIKALRDGDIEIWSLRSRNNKPRFTLEIDAERWDVPVVYGTPESRANARGFAVKQLKGKANRRAGYADVREQAIKFPDEIVFWNHAFRQLGVDPLAVSDFDAVNGVGDALAVIRPNRARALCVGFDAPYRPLAKNQRRVSKRRASKRSTSKRRTSRRRP